MLCIVNKRCPTCPVEMAIDWCSGGKDSCYNMVLCQQYGHEASRSHCNHHTVLPEFLLHH